MIIFTLSLTPPTEILAFYMFSWEIHLGLTLPMALPFPAVINTHSVRTLQYIYVHADMYVLTLYTFHERRCIYMHVIVYDTSLRDLMIKLYELMTWPTSFECNPKPSYLHLFLMDSFFFSHNLILRFPIIVLPCTISHSTFDIQYHMKLLNLRIQHSFIAYWQKINKLMPFLNSLTKTKSTYFMFVSSYWNYVVACYQ